MHDFFPTSQIGDSRSLIFFMAFSYSLVSRLLRRNVDCYGSEIAFRDTVCFQVIAATCLSPRLGTSLFELNIGYCESSKINWDNSRQTKMEVRFSFNDN